MKSKKLIDVDDYNPVLIIDEDKMGATYYYDGSGEISLSIDGDEFFHREDGRIKHHIEYIEEYIDTMRDQINEYKKKIVVCKKSAAALKKYKKRAKL
jgi:hypothetical protein